MGNKSSTPTGFGELDTVPASQHKRVPFSVIVRKDPTGVLPRKVLLEVTPSHVELHRHPDVPQTKRDGPIIKSISLLSVRAWGHNKAAFRIIVLEDMLTRKKIVR